MRIFLSYASEDLPFTGRLAEALSGERLAGFLAPRDITPSTDWLVTLRDELHRCRGLVAVITPAFRRSPWCDQEVGFALGLGQPVIPLRPTVDDPFPHGFLEHLQTLTAEGRTSATVAADIFDALLAHERLQPRLIEIIIDALASEREVTEVVRWASRLRRVDPEIITQERRTRLTAVAARNATLRLDRHAGNILAKILE